MIDISPLHLKLGDEFPVTRDWIYFNHAAVCALPSRVGDAIHEFTTEAVTRGITNYSAWKKQLADTRAMAAKLLGCDSEEVAYVKSTTHGIMCAALSIPWREGDNVVLFEEEFPANYFPWKNLEALGVEMRQAPLRNGVPDMNDLKELIDDRTRAAAISYVSFKTGARIDPSAFAQLCREHNIYSVVDGIQGLGVIPVDVRDWGIDFLSADAHKWLLAPEGVGLLFCSSRVVGDLTPLMTGWCSRDTGETYLEREHPIYPDARRFEEGSHSMIGAHALGAALSLFHDVGMETISSRIRVLTDLLIEGLKSRGWTILSPRREGAWSGIVSASKEGLNAKALAKRAMGRKLFITGRGNEYIRLSPHFYNTPQEIEKALKILDEEEKKL